MGLEKNDTWRRRVAKLIGRKSGDAEGKYIVSDGLTAGELRSDSFIRNIDCLSVSGLGGTIIIPDSCPKCGSDNCGMNVGIEAYQCAQCGHKWALHYSSDLMYDLRELANECSG